MIKQVKCEKLKIVKKIQKHKYGLRTREKKEEVFTAP